MAVLPPSFRRRYMPQSGRFAPGPRPSSPSVELAPLPGKDGFLVTVVEIETPSEGETELGETQIVTVLPGPSQTFPDTSPPGLTPPDATRTRLHAQTARPSLNNHAYTGSPLRLLVHDLVSLARLAWALPFLVWPLRPASALSELAPTLANAWCIAVHIVLAVAQAGFLLCFLPAACMLLPAWMCAVVLASFVGANQLACWLLLNGWRGEAVLHSRAACAPCLPQHAGEQWIFLNGIGTGRHWLQGSIDRLAYTFRRPVMGIHNKTSGLVFDMIECLVQRNLNYATRDVRAAYAILKATLCRPEISRVVLVLHSQGGIVGSMALDWLLQELPHALLAKLELYTFGSAANHANAPRLDRDRDRDRDRAVHMEHYAHTTDFAALWGVLHYTSTPRSPFAGRVFAHTSRRGGHQFCQHYLAGMFPLVRDPDTGAVVGCAEDNAFVSSSIDEQAKVKDVSRLWQYRNGRCPEDIE